MTLLSGIDNAREDTKRNIWYCYTRNVKLVTTDIVCGIFITYINRVGGSIVKNVHIEHRSSTTDPILTSSDRVSIMFIPMTSLKILKG